MSKTVIWLGMFVGSTLGSYVPSWWGAGMFSFSSILGGMIGGIVGVVGGYRLSERWGL